MGRGSACNWRGRGEKRFKPTVRLRVGSLINSMTGALAAVRGSGWAIESRPAWSWHRYVYTVHRSTLI